MTMLLTIQPDGRNDISRYSAGFGVEVQMLEKSLVGKHGMTWVSSDLAEAVDQPFASTFSHAGRQSSHPRIVTHPPPS